VQPRNRNGASHEAYPEHRNLPSSDDAGRRMQRGHGDVAAHFSCLVGTNSTIPPLITAGRERCSSVPFLRHVPWGQLGIFKERRIAGLWLHGPKDGIRKPLSTRNAGASNLADGAALENPDGSTILNGSQGFAKISCATEDDGHA
jgi:hypothetical protein